MIHTRYSWAWLNGHSWQDLGGIVQFLSGYRVLTTKLLSATSEMSGWR